MKKALLAIVIVIAVLSLLGVGGWFLFKNISSRRMSEEERKAVEAQNAALEKIIEDRREETEKNGEADPFSDDGVAKILLIGLDRRTGDTDGHCDAIQLVSVDKNKQEVTITAVPRGTYSPLPPGGKYLPSDYYVSKACGIGGLEYGIKQIEKILGQKEDYLVVVGFSEVLGIFRNLDLPTTETLQWLRHRQGYAIGEPQRAHNHSTFIKQMMIKYIPQQKSVMSTALQYILYKTVKTDLSFNEVRTIADALSAMEFTDHPERIRLAMKPAYDVQDIPYAEEYLGEYLNKMLTPVEARLTPGDYSGLTEEEAQAKLLQTIEEKKDDPDFAVWAFDNALWLQVEDEEKRMTVQYDFLVDHLATLSVSEERKNAISDYILEMEYYNEEDWAAKGRELLQKEIGQ